MRSDTCASLPLLVHRRVKPVESLFQTEAPGHVTYHVMHHVTDHSHHLSGA